MVDPAYTAKALALVSRYADDGNVVFWHTGGQLDAVALAAEVRAVTTGSRPAAGPPVGPPAAELVEAGFELENADAPVLHHGMNLADLAHLLDLASAGVIPPEAARRLLALLLEVIADPGPRLPLRPGQRRAVQLAGAVLRQPGRGRGGLAACGPPAAGGGPGRLPAAAAQPT